MTNVSGRSCVVFAGQKSGSLWALGHGLWVLALPPSYVAGLQVITRSLVAGHDPVLVIPGERAGDVRSDRRRF